VPPVFVTSTEMLTAPDAGTRGALARAFWY